MLDAWYQQPGHLVRMRLLTGNDVALLTREGAEYEEFGVAAKRRAATRTHREGVV